MVDATQSVDFRVSEALEEVMYAQSFEHNLESVYKVTSELGPIISFPLASLAPIKKQGLLIRGD